MRAELGAFDRSKGDSSAMRLPGLAVGLLAIAALTACGPEIPNPNKQRDSGATGSGGTDSGRDAGESGAAGGGRSGRGGDGGKGGAGAGGQAGAGSGASAGSDAGSSGSSAGSSGAGSGGGAGMVARGAPAGSGGNAGCTDDSVCAVDQPECKTDGTCGSCTGDEACTGRAGAERCALSGALQGQCVRCVEHADCTDAAAPYCAGNRCVECESHAQCTDPSKPECSAGVCGGCTGDGSCAGRTQGTHCVMAGGDPMQGECASCTSDSHCENPTPECGASHTCVGCTSNESCEGRLGTTVCDQSSDAAFTGKCVTCTGAHYESCGSAPGGTPYVCDSLARTCTTQTKASALTCEPCVSDAQCATGRVCMRTKFGVADTGSFCLWTQDAAGTSAPNGNCGAVRPYIIGETTWQSVDGAMPSVCKPAVTTCQGQNEFRGQSCSGATAEGHAQCGAQGVADGYCAPFLTGHVCTVPCVSFQDCQDTRPGDDMECKQQTLGGTDVKVCQFQ